MVDIKQDRPIFTCENGVILQLRAVPALAIVAMQRQLQEPSVPVFMNEEKQREEENPNDPNYIKAKQAYDTELGFATTTAYLANGVSVFKVPDDVDNWEDEEWAEGLKLAGIDVPDKGVARRVAWLKYYVLRDDELGDLITSIAMAGGLVKESDVEAVTFRDNGTGSTDTQGEASSEI